MTLILGLEHGGKTYLVGDRFAGNEHYSDTVYKPKILKRKIPFSQKEIGFGFSGTFNLYSLLKFKLKIPKYDEKKYKNDEEEWLLTEFYESFIECLKDSILWKDESGSFDGDFVIAFNGSIYYLASDFAITRSARGYHAAGAGMIMAMCACESILKYNKKIDPDKFIDCVMRTVEECNPYVSAPFDVIILD